MSDLINLLMVEDSEFDAILLTHELKKAGFELDFECVQTANEMQNALRVRNWDVVISDYNLPSFSAPKALDVLKQSGQDLPFIIVSGTIGEATAVEIMRSGAHDYLMKGNLNRLAEVLRREIRDARGRAERRRAEAALKESEKQLRLLFERSNDAIFVLEKESGMCLDANKAAEKITGRDLQELKNLTFLEIAPEIADTHFLQVDDANDLVEFDNISFHRPDGQSRIAHLTILPIDGNRKYAIAHDITEQLQAENALRQRAEELEVLYRTSLEINSQTDLLPLLQTIVERAATLLNARMGGLYLVQPESSTLELVVAYNLPDSYIGATLKLGEGLSGLIAETGETIMVDDYRLWGNQAEFYKSASFRRVLGIPMRVKGQVIGIINITDDEITGPYSPREIRLASMFADQAALAVENARLLGAVQRELIERKQAEMSLRESEISYRGLFNSVADAIYIQDEDGHFLDVNMGAIQMYGYQKDEILGKTHEILAAKGKNDLKIVARAVKRAFSGEAQHFEFWGQRADGEIFPKEVRIFPGTYFGQKVIITLAHDITERKKVEENLRSTQAFLDHVLKAIPLGVSVFNINTLKVEFENTVNSNLRGSSIEEFNVLSRTDRAISIHPDDRDARMAFMENLETLADGEVRVCEFRRISSDGAWHWLRYRYFVFDRDQKGSLTKLLAVTEDVTSTKHAEQALQRQLKELTILHNIARAGIQVNVIDELMEIVTQEVGNSFYPENFGVLLYDSESKVLRAHPSYRGLTEGIKSVVSLEKSVSGQVLTSGKPRRIADVQFEPNFIMVTKDVRSELCVPIKIGEETIGVINAESKQLDFFSDEDERLLLTIAGQLAISIERLRLFNLERERRQEAENLRQATAVISTSLDLDHVLESILISLKKVVYYDSASVFLLNGDHLNIMIVNGVEVSPDFYKQNYSAEDELFLEVKNRRQPVILENASADPRFQGWGETSRVRGWMSVPLITRGEVIGYITLDNYKESAYGQEAGMMAQSFAHQAAAAIENARLFKEIQSSLEELNRAYESTIEGWSKAMDLRDKETEGHTLRVTKMTEQLAVAMGIEEEQLIHLRRGALLHDIGKMGVPDRILLKPDNLTDDEMVIMRRHPQYAYDMLSTIAYLRPALDIPYSHHERWDGKGYPQGLQGNDIPLAARLFSIVDVWDALTSDRPYRPAWTPKEALGYIKELAGIQFDPEIVDKFVDLMRE